MKDALDSAIQHIVHQANVVHQAYHTDSDTCWADCTHAFCMDSFKEKRKLETALSHLQTDYSQEEREEMLRAMRAVSSGFYIQAQRTGCHAFLEFTGLMNEFLKVCERENTKGRDFNTAAHGGEPLGVLPWELDYIATKLECIFGKGFVDALANRRRRESHAGNDSSSDSHVL